MEGLRSWGGEGQVGIGLGPGRLAGVRIPGHGDRSSAETSLPLTVEDGFGRLGRVLSCLFG